MCCRPSTVKAGHCETCFGCHCSPAAGFQRAVLRHRLFSVLEHYHFQQRMIRPLGICATLIGSQREQSGPPAASPDQPHGLPLGLFFFSEELVSALNMTCLDDGICSRTMSNLHENIMARTHSCLIAEQHTSHKSPRSGPEYNDILPVVVFSDCCTKLSGEISGSTYLGACDASAWSSCLRLGFHKIVPK